jgi:hypothetical protein
MANKNTDNRNSISRSIIAYEIAYEHFATEVFADYTKEERRCQQKNAFQVSDMGIEDQSHQRRS